MGTFYISPTGSGDRSGSSLANAATISNLNTLVKKAGAGGEVLLVADAGTYKVGTAINITASGSKDAPVTIKGISSTGEAMNAHFEGTRPAVYAASNPSGNELFKLAAGANNLVFENMTINNTGTAFRATGNLSNLTIQNIDANNVARFFEDYAGGTSTTATISGLTIKDVDVKGFSKGVVRLQYDTHDVVIQNVTGDSLRQDGDDFAIGVHLDGTVHNVLVDHTTMQNATDTVGGGYWNADGFATERGVYNVTFQDTVSRGNTDGGYDLKSTGTTLIRTVAEDNARNYRIWGDATMIDAVALNPHLRGGTSTQVQVWVAAGAKLKIDGGLIADSGTKTRVFDNSGTVTINNTELVYASGAIFSGTKKPLGYTADDVSVVKSSGLFSTVDYMTSFLTSSTVGVAEAVKSIPAAVADVAPVVTAPVVATPAVTAPVVTAPVVTAPVVTAPVVTAPVVTTPVTQAAKAAPASVEAVKAAPVHAEGSHLLSKAATETFTGTAGRDVFDYSAAGAHGKDSIVNFGSDDVLVLDKALKDSNNDGLIYYGSGNVLTLTGNSGTLKFADLKSGVRYLGTDGDDFYYGGVAVRPKGAVEGKLFQNDTLKGDAGDKAVSKFFVDTALHQKLGDDIIRDMGAKDIIITTSKLGDDDVGSHISAIDHHFAMAHEGDALGSLTLYDIKGAAIDVLEYDGMKDVNGVDYFVYSMVGSAAGVGSLV